MKKSLFEPSKMEVSSQIIPSRAESGVALFQKAPFRAEVEADLIIDDEKQNLNQKGPSLFSPGKENITISSNSANQDPNYHDGMNKELALVQEGGSLKLITSEFVLPKLESQITISNTPRGSDSRRDRQSVARSSLPESSAISMPKNVNFKPSCDINCIIS